MKDLSFKNGKITAETVLERVRELDPYNNNSYKKLDDVSLAKIFSDVFRQVARYNTTAKEWYIYDGVIWKRDTGGMVVEAYAKMLSRALYIYSADIDSDVYRKYIATLGARQKRSTMLQDARDFNFITTEQFDEDMSLFNCKNCVIDLATLEVVAHDPELLLSKVSNVVYNPEARDGEFLQFLDEILLGDQSKIDYLQELIGYTLTGTGEEEQLFMLYGQTTRNGKSTFLSTIAYMFGDYARNIQPETLAQRKDRNGSSPSGDIARLDGCRFLQMSEPPKHMVFNVALLKTLTGRDVITARFLHERDFEFVPRFVLYVNTNHLPIVSDDTLFSSNRIQVITFEKHFEEEEQDPNLKLRLKQEETISFIFNWCLEGLKRYRDAGNRLHVPESVKGSTSEYRETSDKFANFVEECFVPEVDGIFTVKRAYEVYSAWCTLNGYCVDNKRTFLDELRRKSLLSETGTINGKTTRNVVKGYELDDAPAMRIYR